MTSRKAKRFAIGQHVWYNNPKYPTRRDRLTVASRRLRYRVNSRWEWGYACQLPAAVSVNDGPNEWTPKVLLFWEGYLTDQCPECGA